MTRTANEYKGYRRGVRGQNGDLISDSNSPSAKFSDTWRARSVVEISRNEFSKNAKILYIDDFQIFNRRYLTISYFRPQISFWAPYLAKLMHHMGYSNVIWKFENLIFSAIFSHIKTQKIAKIAIFGLLDPKNSRKSLYLIALKATTWPNMGPRNWSDAKKRYDFKFGKPQYV